MDNKSSDNTLLEVKKLSFVKVIENQQNYGFGKANNIGASIAKGKYLLLLNSDAYLTDDKILNLVKLMEEHKEIGGVSPKLLLEDGVTEQKDCIGRDPNLLRLLSRRAAVEPQSKGKEYVEVDLVAATALVVRRDVFLEIQGFDERFFMYFEDSDLCRRIRGKGFSVVWFPGVKVVHLGGRSIETNWQRKKLYYKNQEKYFEIYYGKFSVYLLRLFRIPLIVYTYLKGRRKSC